ncbi:MAG: DUF3237 family protein [Acidimicrobiales bacterium]
MTSSPSESPSPSPAPASDPAPIELELVARATITLAQPLEAGPALLGVRRVIGITGGRFEGPSFGADILPGGADWQTVAPDGTAVIDTRYSARTDAGHVLEIATQGFRHGAPEVLARIAAGEPVGADEYYFRLTASLSTADPALEWVNRTVFVASATRAQADVVYDLFAVR